MSNIEELSLGKTDSTGEKNSVVNLMDLSHLVLSFTMRVDKVLEGIFC